MFYGWTQHIYIYMASDTANQIQEMSVISLLFRYICREMCISVQFLVRCVLVYNFSWDVY